MAHGLSGTRWSLMTMLLILWPCLTPLRVSAQQPQLNQRLNVLLIMADDLTAEALSCYGNRVCRTPAIDGLAEKGVRFSRAYCQAPFCGPSRASMLTGYYPHATGVLDYSSPRRAIGNRATWPELFKRAGYYTVRVNKIFHMGVPTHILTGAKGANGPDDAASWTERFNLQGPEWQAPGMGEWLERRPRGEPNGVTFYAVQADGNDLVHADGKAADKACELIRLHKNKPFWIGVGFVRPHVPFVAPKKYFDAFPFEKIVLPERQPDDWRDIPRAGINYKTTQNMQMDETNQKKAIASYYACVTYIDALVGKVLTTLRKEGLDDKTIVIFTSDHGFHLGEHNFWAKVSLHEESARVPLIIRVPGKRPAVCSSLVELIDLYPTTCKLCGLDVPAGLQGQDISAALDGLPVNVREFAFSINTPQYGNGFLLRDPRWACIFYGENPADDAVELYDMENDPKQFTNLARYTKYRPIVDNFRKKLGDKLTAIRRNNLAKR